MAKKSRADVMQPQQIDFSQPVKSVGGMAHSTTKKEDVWGGKIPPYPRSDLKKKTRSGMALTNNL